MNKKLAEKWRKKLEASGFEDIEDEQGRLKEYHSVRFRSKGLPQITVWARQRYFELARQLLHTFPFSNATNRRLWQYHSEGMSTSEIAERLSMSPEAAAQAIEHIAGHIKNV